MKDKTALSVDSMMSKARSIETKVRVKMMLITPEWAAKMLRYNVNNRDLNDGNLKLMTSIIKGNQYKINGDTIVFSDANRLLNGQHRLMSVVETNIPIQTLVVWNVDDSLFYTYDNHKQRRDADYLQINARAHGREMTNVIARAAIVTGILNMQRGRFGQAISSNGNRSNKISDIEKINFESSNVDILDNIVAIALRTNKRFKGIAPKTIGCLFWELRKKDEDMAVNFLNQYSTGENLHTKHPILLLRNEIVKNQTTTNNKYNESQKFRLMVRAWNELRGGSKFNAKNTNDGSFETIL